MPLVKSDVSSVDLRERLPGLRVEEVDGISEVGVKSTDLGKTTRLSRSIEARRMAKAVGQDTPDGEGRKLGERTGLDTQVVPAVNNAGLV